MINALTAQIHVATRIQNRDEASRAVIDAEAAAVQSLDAIRRKYRVARPERCWVKQAAPKGLGGVGRRRAKARIFYI